MREKDGEGMGRKKGFLCLEFEDLRFLGLRFVGVRELKKGRGGWGRKGRENEFVHVGFLCLEFVL